MITFTKTTPSLYNMQGFPQRKLLSLSVPGSCRSVCSLSPPFSDLGSNTLRLLLSELCNSVGLCTDLRGNVDCKSSPRELFCLLISLFLTNSSVLHMHTDCSGALDWRCKCQLSSTSSVSHFYLYFEAIVAQVIPIPTNMCYSSKQALSISLYTKINLQWYHFPRDCHDFSANWNIH